MTRVTPPRRPWRCIFVLLLLSIAVTTVVQSRLDSILGKPDPQKFARGIREKAAMLEDKLTPKSLPLLSSLQAQEEKIITAQNT